jgi:hypothetical protein
MPAYLLSSKTVEALPESTRPYSRTEHLAKSLLLGRFNWDRWMAMYSAHLDESGHPDDSDYLVVAGAVASVQQWVDFETDWKAVLAPFNTDLFHTVDFAQRKKPFDKITAAQARDIHLRLATIICNRTEKLMSFTLDMKKYKSVNSRWLLAEAYGHPYPLAARSCIAGVEQWARDKTVSINEFLFFCENGAKDKGQLLWMADRDHFPRPDFKEKSELLPLQAGDFIAWHQFQIQNGTDGNGVSASVMHLFEFACEYQWRTMNLDDGEWIATALDLPLRSPDYVYKAQVIRYGGGVRRAVVHSRRRDDRSSEKLDRKTLFLADPKIRTPEELDALRREHLAKKRANIKP